MTTRDAVQWLVLLLVGYKDPTFNIHSTKFDAFSRLSIQHKIKPEPSTKKAGFSPAFEVKLLSS
jgi:hypothetical protein